MLVYQRVLNFSVAKNAQVTSALRRTFPVQRPPLIGWRRMAWWCDRRSTTDPWWHHGLPWAPKQRGPQDGLGILESGYKPEPCLILPGLFWVSENKPLSKLGANLAGNHATHWARRQQAIRTILCSIIFLNYQSTSEYSYSKSIQKLES